MVTSRLVLLVSLCLLGFHFTPSQGAGMSTHSEVGERALFWFTGKQYPEYATILKSHKNWWQPGTFFPDWGYNCRGFGKESESAHWSPFINSTAVYIHQTYPKPWDQDTEGLVAFLFGIMAHSVTDNSWHSLGMYEGIIEAMSYTEFSGDFNGAHTMADTGGEFVLKFYHDLAGNAQLVWNLPAEDLVKAYEFHYGSTTVTEADMEFCLNLGYIGIWANQIFGDLVFPFIQNSPMLVEEYENYFLGGLNDMAAWTARCWEDLALWIERGGALRPMCTLMENQWGHAKDIQEPEPALKGDQALEYLRSLGYDVAMSKIGRHLSARLIRKDGQDPLEYHRAQVKKLRERLAEEHMLLTGEKEEEEKATCIKESAFRNNSTVTYSIQTSYSQLGHSLIKGDFNGDGIDDLAFGAPTYGLPDAAQTGVVYLVYGERAFPTSGSFDVSRANVILNGEDIYSRFGWDLTVVDLNRDGIDDLAVSAPTYNGLEMYYDGRVYVYFGSRSGLQTIPGIIIKTDQPFPNVDPTRNHPFKFVLMGHVLNSGDIDEDGFLDLIVGCPLGAPHGVGHQNGFISIFLSSSNHAGLIDIYDNSDYELSGSQEYQRFGSYSAVTQTSAGQRLLLVGSNYYQIDSQENQVVGRIYGYDLNDLSSTLFTITGNAQYQKFGSPFVAGDFFGNNQTLLAVSAISEKFVRDWQAGSVRVFDLTGLSGDLNFRDVKVITTIQGGEQAGHFSWDLETSSTSLWVSEPFYGNLRADEKASTGRIFEWKFGSNFPSGTIRDCVVSADTCIVGESMRGSFGNDILSLDLNADGMEDLVVASSHSDLGSPTSGEIVIFFR